MFMQAKEIYKDLGKVNTWSQETFESLQDSGILCDIDPDDLDTDLLNKMQYLPPPDSENSCEAVVSGNIYVLFWKNY